jgi:hypothetical protein
VNWRALTYVGIAVAAFGIVVFGSALDHVVATGDCGSDNRGTYGPPCPPGATVWIFSLLIGIAGFMLGSWLTRGLGRFAFGALFLTGAGVFAYEAATGAHGHSDWRYVSILLAVVFAPIGLGPFVMSRLQGGKTARAMWLMQHGQSAEGTVIDVTDTGVTINDNPRVRLTFQVKPETGAEFQADKTVTVSRVQIPQVGQKAPVWFDPNDHTKFVVGMPSSPEMVAASAADSGGLAEAMQDLAKRAAAGEQVDQDDVAQALAAATKQTGSAPAGGLPEEDPLDRLAKLTELRKAGALTDSEFEVQKAKILADT